jgi:hypothetical protein
MNRSLLPTLLLLLPTSGCILAKDIGDSPADTDGPSETDSEDAGSASTDPSAGETSEASLPLMCELNPDFNCETPLPCDAMYCGTVLSGLDKDGCPRLPCGGAESCPAGYSCVTLGDWGMCGSSHTWCEEYEGECLCGATDDCSPHVSYCVEDEIAPPAVCSNFTDEASCLEAGCTTFFMAPQVDHESGEDCSCGELVPTCLWFPTGNLGGDDAITPYVFLDDVNGYDIRLFPQSYDAQPLGWQSCDEVQWLETCTCARSLSCE